MFLKGHPPKHARDNWGARATKIGSAGWNTFHHLFFGCDGQLHAVKSDGSFPSPTYAEDNWSACATKIGSGGWKTLF